MRMPVTLPKSTRCVAWSLVSMISQSNTARPPISVGAPLEMWSHSASEKRSSTGRPVWPGKALGERLLVAGQRIQRKIAVPDEGFVLQILAVEADQNRRRRVGHRAGGDHGRAAFARRSVGGDDMDRARKPRHRIAIGLRPDFILLQHSGIPCDDLPIAIYGRRACPTSNGGLQLCRRIRLLRSLGPAFTSCRALPAGPMLSARGESAPPHAISDPNTLRRCSACARRRSRRAGLDRAVGAADRTVRHSRRADAHRRHHGGRTTGRSGVRLSIADDGCTAEGGARAARELVAAQVQIVVGFLCSEAIEAALPILKEANIPTISGRRAHRQPDRRQKARPAGRSTGSDRAPTASARRRAVCWRGSGNASSSPSSTTARSTAANFPKACASPPRRPGCRLSSSIRSGRSSTTRSASSGGCSGLARRMSLPAATATTSQSWAATPPQLQTGLTVAAGETLARRSANCRLRRAR